MGGLGEVSGIGEQGIYSGYEMLVEVKCGSMTKLEECPYLAGIAILQSQLGD